MDSDFLADEDVAIIGQRLFEESFQGSPEVLHRSILLDGRPYSINGVAPAGLLTLGGVSETEVWVPVPASLRSDRGDRALFLVGRMKDGAEIDEIRSRASAVAVRLAHEYPDLWTDSRERAYDVSVLSEAQERIPPPIRLLVISQSLLVGFLKFLILIVSSSNVGGLLLARGLRRRREMAIRAALGADRMQMAIMLTAEGLLLALVSLGMAFLAVRFLIWLARRGNDRRPGEGRALCPSIRCPRAPGLDPPRPALLQ
jgi:putative ABC transport system permease protein